MNQTDKLSIADKIKSGAEIEVKITKKLVIPQPEEYKRTVMQGGCTDGKYGYYAMNECGSTDTVKSKIYKVDLESWQITATADNLLLCHANDMAYDTKHNRIIVTHCNVRPDEVTIINPEDLGVIEVRRIPVEHYALAYNSKRNQYVAGKSRCFDFSVLDEDFNELVVYPGEDGYIKQGMECDDDFIYFFHSSVRYNHIWIYDWNGNFIRKLKVPMVGESENLFIRGDRFIAAFNGDEEKTGIVCEMTLETK